MFFIQVSDFLDSIVKRRWEKARKSNNQNKKIHYLLCQSKVENYKYLYYYSLFRNSCKVHTDLHLLI